MLQTLAHDNGKPFTHATIRKCGVYLDTHTIIGLAKSDSSRQDRFVDALAAGADLMFSVTNASELSALQGNSSFQVRAFLDRIEHHWFPLEMDAFEVIKRELNGQYWAAACSSRMFMEDFRNVRLSQTHGTLIDLSEQFFRLSAVLDWMQPQRDSIQQGMREMDAALIAKINRHREKSQADPAWLDRGFPPVQFNPLIPATFTYCHVVRQLIVDRGFQLKKGDGLDFCHAVVGISFSKVATLDKHWKRRIAALPQPNGVAKVFYGPELDDFLDAVESAVNPSQHGSGNC